MDTTLYDTSGGDLSLNFLNTTDWPGSSAPSDSLQTYADLLRWAFEAGTLQENERTHLIAQAEANPAGAAEALQTAHSVRTALYHILISLGSAQKPTGHDQERFNLLLSRALGHRVLTLEPHTIHWAFQSTPLPLDYPLWPVVLAAADLLLSTDIARIHTCANHECGWAFLDRSRNGSRKWCSSTACGNRERVRQYYARKR